MGRGRAYISLLNPHAALPHFHRFTRCDSCGSETVCREGAFSKNLHRRLWLCYRRGDDGCCWQKAQAEKGTPV